MVDQRFDDKWAERRGRRNAVHRARLDKLADGLRKVQDAVDEVVEEEQQQRSARKYAVAAVVLVMAALACVLVFWPGAVRTVSGWLT